MLPAMGTGRPRVGGCLLCLSSLILFDLSLVYRLLSLTVSRAAAPVLFPTQVILPLRLGEPQEGPFPRLMKSFWKLCYHSLMTCLCRELELFLLHQGKYEQGIISHRYGEIFPNYTPWNTSSFWGCLFGQYLRNTTFSTSCLRDSYGMLECQMAWGYLQSGKLLGFI